MAIVDRRSFCAAVVGSAATLPWRTRAAQTPASAPIARRVDVHHHFAPPEWLAVAQGRPLLQPTIATWTAERSLEDMDKGGVSIALLSITNPGIWFGDVTQTRRLARLCNEYGANTVRARATRFGLFAVLPLPDVDSALKEIEYAYDTLKADGVGLFTSYGNTWLGSPAFRPVFEELNRRKAVVAVHPTAADCCRELAYAPGLPASSIEYGTDTTRAIAAVVVSGDAMRFPDIRFIWSHAGGTMPFLAGRIANAASAARPEMAGVFMAQVKRFFYDTAGAANPGAMASLRQLVPPAQVLFGTDYPPGGPSASAAKALDDTQLFTGPELETVYRSNALGLLPRFAG
jgi:predicted TIM-barrel fold metal-dependent hydrolase